MYIRPITAGPTRQIRHTPAYPSEKTVYCAAFSPTAGGVNGLSLEGMDVRAKYCFVRRWTGVEFLG